MKDNQQDNAGVIAPPPLIYAGGLTLGLLLSRALPLTVLPRTARRILGGLLAGSGVFLATVGFRTMRGAGTPVDPRETVTALVVQGPFRYTRNPLYLSMTMLSTGIAFLANATAALLLLPGVLFIMQRGVIEREERYLERRFGASYTDYKTRVRRWL
ncbi:MAG: methyltransferase family protein [Dehalococcoidia bacterium]